jgi:hypothetical protein
MTVEAIKEAILALPEKEQLAIEEWLADRWDEQIERDFQPGGRGEKLLAEIDADIDAGKFAPMKLPLRD